ncbi:MAG: 3-oxoadipate enol-lactonase [Candidatus Sphingomonas colombiensis]|nr:3-oxoadipate enol-lactonase [Sphingomonas sp.]WEK41987.1 MAG: 3-oxoadipate enol-lactonase [Sphingomonas sp.]
MTSGEFRTDDGCRIFWQTAGDRDLPALLLANSLGTNLTMWDDQIAAWSKHRFVIRYDMRGHGRSDVTPIGFGIERLGADALAVLDHLGIQQCDFVGLSLGGMVGQWLGLSAPARVRHLVLANTSAYMGPPESWDSRIALVKSSGMAAIASAVVERWFTPEFQARSAEPQRILGMLLDTDPIGYTAACAAIRDMDQRGSVGAISLPTLVIGGSRDPATPPDQATFLANAIQHAQLRMLDTAHLSNIEMPNEFGRLVDDFITEN